MPRRLESISITQMTEIKEMDQVDVEIVMMDGILDIVMEEDWLEQIVPMVLECNGPEAIIAMEENNIEVENETLDWEFEDRLLEELMEIQVAEFMVDMVIAEARMTE